MKLCRKCDTSKPLAEFYNNRSAYDGKATYCKPCWRTYMSEQSVKHADRKRESTKRWLEANRDRKLAQQAAWRKANADHIKARNAAYREAHREEIRAKSREYAARTSEANKAKYRADPEPAKKRAREWASRNRARNVIKSREWRQANPEKYREHMRLAASRRRARKSELPAYDITAKDLRRVYSSPCAVAGCTNTDIQFDHVIPIARGGSHGIGNGQPLCASHNAAKGARLWVEFRVYLIRQQSIAA